MAIQETRTHCGIALFLGSRLLPFDIGGSLQAETRLEDPRSRSPLRGIEPVPARLQGVDFARFDVFVPVYQIPLLLTVPDHNLHWISKPDTGVLTGGCK